MGEALAMGLLEAGWERPDIDLAARRIERARLGSFLARGALSALEVLSVASR